MPITKELHSWLMSRKVSLSSEKRDTDTGESKSILNSDESDGAVNNEGEEEEEPPVRKSVSSQTLVSNADLTDSTILTIASLSSLDNEMVKVTSTKAESESESDHEAQVSLLLDSATLNSHHRCLSPRVLFGLDVLVSLVLFSPLVGIYWFSTWTFIDRYFVHERPVLSNLLSYFGGLLVLLPSYVFQRSLQSGYDRFKRFGKFGTFVRFLIRNTYMVIVNVAIVAEWRGLWNICDHYFYNSLSSQIFMAAIAILFFCLTRSTGSLISTPFIMYRDDHVQPFACESRFKIQNVSYFQQYLFDFFWAELIECFALILAWRGIGGFYEYSFGGHQINSLVAVFFFSHFSYFAIIVAKLAVLGGKFVRLSERAALLLKGLFNVFMFASSCLAWKFYWDLIELVLTINLLHANEFYFHIVSFVLSNLVAIAFGVTVLLAGPAASVNETPPSQQASTSETLFEMNYLSNFLKKC